MAQDEKVQALLDKITYDVTDFFAEFSRPARSSIILKNHKSTINRLGLDWHTIEMLLKEQNRIKVKRHELKNSKWYFPTEPEMEESAMREMVQYMED